MRSGKLKIFCAVLLLTVFTILQAACLPFMAGNEEEHTDVKVTADVELYFIEKNAIEGEIGKAPLIQVKESIVLPKEMSKKEEVDSFVAVSALNMLKTVPKDIESFADTAIFEDILFNKVIIKDNKAVVDIAASGLEGKGGSTEELLFVSQIIETIMRTNTDVESVKFVIDGKETETLMGHLDTLEPFTEAPIKFER